MKRLLCTSAFVAVAAVALLFILGHRQSLTATTNTLAPSHEPIKVLDLRLTSATQSKAAPIDGLEVEIQNTSSKPIQYLVIHAEIPGRGASPLRIPLGYGKAPVPNAKGRRVESLQPGAKINLPAPKATLENINKQIVAIGRTPTAKEIQTKTNVVIFDDKTAWAGGSVHYPDPADAARWVSGEELARKESAGGNLFAIFSKANYKTTTNDCYRFSGINLQYCCSYCCNGGELVDLYVGNFNFTGDPTGFLAPNTVESCCPQGLGCCFHDESTGCN